jgi:CheY-like chemotaxis protein
MALLAGALENGNLRSVKLLYLEDDPNDVELLQMLCLHQEPDCEITAVADRVAFVQALESGKYAGIISDSGVYDLTGPEAVRMARRLAPAMPYVFYCGTMADAKRAELAGAGPDGIFSKDNPEDLGTAIGLLRKLAGCR